MQDLRKRSSQKKLLLQKITIHGLDIPACQLALVCDAGVCVALDCKFEDLFYFEED